MSKNVFKLQTNFTMKTFLIIKISPQNIIQIDIANKVSNYKISF